MDLRYIHKTEFVPAQQPKNEFDLNPMPASLVYPGWIDADYHEWARALRKPGDCEDIFCPCHSYIGDLF